MISKGIFNILSQMESAQGLGLGDAGLDIPGSWGETVLSVKETHEKVHENPHPPIGVWGFNPFLASFECIWRNKGDFSLIFITFGGF